MYEINTGGRLVILHQFSEFLIIYYFIFSIERTRLILKSIRVIRIQS